jgi:hypothetical protein
MNNQQVEFLISMLRDCFPTSKGYDGPTVVQSWHTMGLCDLSFDKVLLAVRKGIKENRWDYPPSINDILKAYNDASPKVPMDYEGLSNDSQIKHAIDMRVNKRHPEVDPKRQFRDIEEHQEALAINRQQRLKYRNELFKEVKPEVQRLLNSGMKSAQIVSQVFGVEYVKSDHRRHLGQGTNDVVDLAKSIAKALPGVGNGS